MNYLPSKKFILTFGIGAGVVFLGYIGWIAIKNFLPKFTSNTYSSKQARALDQAYTRFSQDSDKDGLKDWEETLWNTDPKNSDSDADGTMDGDEVKQNRDPNKAGPDDMLSIDQIASSAQKSKTLSDELARNIDIRYFTQKGLSGNQPLTENQKNSVAQAFINDIEKELSAYGDIYTEKDIVIAPNESMRSYGNKLGAFLSTTFGGLSGFELQIVDRAGKSGNMRILQQLDSYIEGYKKIITFAKKQPVPPAMVKGHLIFINAVNNLKIADEKMKLLEVDGGTALIGTKLFGRESLRLVDFLRLLRDELRASNTVFDASEPGAFFYTYFEIQLKNN